MYAFSIADLRAQGAYVNDKIKALRVRLGREVTENESVPMSVWAEITPDTSDLIWVLCARPSGARIAVDIAIRAAERALPYTGDGRAVCEAAIAAARKCVDDPASWTWADLNAAERAAYAKGAAANASSTVDAAFNATRAAGRGHARSRAMDAWLAARSTEAFAAWSAAEAAKAAGAWAAAHNDAARAASARTIIAQTAKAEVWVPEYFARASNAANCAAVLWAKSAAASSARAATRGVDDTAGIAAWAVARSDVLELTA